MQFEEKQEQVARSLESLLEYLLTPFQGDSISEVPDVLLSAMRYAVLGAGKRLRPVLLVASAEIFGVVMEDSLRAAAALECLHCYSLIHDDLPSMDNHEIRRGKPTVHLLFGEAMGVLSGDSLLTLAFEIMASKACHADSAVRSELCCLLACAAGARGMVGGQVMDMGIGFDCKSDQDVLRLQRMKTGALIRFALEAGAVIGKAAPEPRKALLAYADALGLVFQLADDLLDRRGDPCYMGKGVMQDSKAGKVTFIDLLGEDGAQHKLATLVDEAVSHLSIFGSKGDILRKAAYFAATRRH